MTGAAMSWHNGELFIRRNFCELFLCTGEQAAAFFISNIIIIWAFCRAGEALSTCGQGAGEYRWVDKFWHQSVHSSTALLRSPGYQLFFWSLKRYNLTTFFCSDPGKCEGRKYKIYNSAVLNENQFHHTDVLGLVTRNCCQRLCFDNVPGLSSCAGCRVSLFSSRSWAARWLLIVWNDFLPLFVIPISPPHRTQAPGTIKHDITRTDTPAVNTGCGTTQHYYTPLHRWPSSARTYTTTSFQFSVFISVPLMRWYQCNANVK